MSTAVTSDATTRAPTGGRVVQARLAPLQAVGLRALAGITAACVVEVVLCLTRPRIDGEPLSPLADGDVPGLPRADAWGWGLALALAALLLASAAPLRRTGPGAALALSLAAAALPLLAAARAPAQLLLEHWPIAIACLPSTAFAVFLLTSAQRFCRAPRAALATAFGWGLLVAAGLATSANTLAFRTVLSVLSVRSQDDAAQGSLASARAGIRIDLMHALAWHAGIFEELAKATGVLVVLVLFRRRVGDVVTGAVLGGVVGLGFNLTESVLYMSATDAAGGFQYWMRQSVGLLGAHTAFSAVAGAGLGAATRIATPGRRALTAGAGLLAAAGSHVANDTLPGWFAQLPAVREPSSSDVLATLVLAPLFILVIQAPVVVLYVLLLRRGVREQAAGFAAALPAETVDDSGAVTPPEAPVLLNPAARIWVVVRTARLYGLPTAMALRRLHAAQLELVRWRWLHPGDADGDEAGGDRGGDGARQLERLRERVLRCKTRGRRRVRAGAA